MTRRISQSMRAIWAGCNRSRSTRIAAVLASLLAAVLFVSAAIAMSLPILLRYSHVSSLDIVDLPLYRPVLNFLSEDRCPIPQPYGRLVAEPYWKWCDIFAVRHIVRMMVKLNDGSLFRFEIGNSSLWDEDLVGVNLPAEGDCQAEIVNCLPHDGRESSEADGSEP